jgi:hypothetical protein
VPGGSESGESYKACEFIIGAPPAFAHSRLALAALSSACDPLFLVSASVHAALPIWLIGQLFPGWNKQDSSVSGCCCLL